MDAKHLIEKAKAGDNEAFGKLYEFYYVPIFRYISFRIRKKEDTEDLVQIVFLKVYESIENYREKGKDPLSFFFTVARTTVIDYLRKKKDLPLYENVEIEASKDNPEEYVQTSEQAELVSEAIQSLNEDQKEVILLKFMAELSNSEIAKQIVTNFRIFAIFVPKTRLLITIYNLQSVANKISGFTPKIQDLINNLKSQGKDVTSLQSSLDDINSRLTNINSTLSADKTLVLGVTTSTSTTDAKSTFDKVRKDLADVRQSLAQIRHDFATMRDTFRLLITGGNSSNASASVSPTPTPSSTP